MLNLLLFIILLLLVLYLLQYRSVYQLGKIRRRFGEKIVELRELIETGRAIISVPDSEEMIKVIAERASAIMNVDVCSIRLLDEKSAELVLKGGYGLSKDHAARGPLKVGEGIAGRVIQQSKPIVVTDLRKEKRLKYTDFIYSDGLCSLASAPLFAKEKPIGVIDIYTKTTRNFSKEEIALFSTLASYAAVAIENILSYENLRENYLATIRSLALAVESRNPYTSGHSERVAQFAADIAKELGLSEKEVEILKFAGILHDIGMGGISDTITLKPDKLSFAEAAQIKLHPARGTEMLGPMEFLKSAMPAIKHHHESFDGEGYPEGLQGRDVPLLARILGLAEAFDAMTSERPYRKALSREEALEEIKKHTGEHFDPIVVEAFLSTLKSKGG